MATLFLFGSMVLLLVLLLSLYHLWQNISIGKRPPPGPRTLPLVGHLHLFSKGCPPHVLFWNLSMNYGPIMQLRLGSVPLIVASTKEAAREFFKTHDATFASRPPSTAGRLLSYNYKDLGLAPYGEHWRDLRKLCVQELFSKIDSFKDGRRDEVKSVVATISSSCGKVVDIRSMLSEISFNYICHMLIGKRYFGQDATDRDGAAAFLQMIEEIFQICGAFSISEYLPWLRWMDLDGIESRFKAVSKRTDEFLERVILEHRLKQKCDDAPEDFIDMLLKLRDNGAKCLEGDSIKALLTNLFTGGSDTTAVTIEWALAELIKHPSCMAEVVNEVTRVVGSHRLVEESDISKLHYLQAVIKETFRLHPPAPLLLPHYSEAASKVMGYDIPKGTRLLVNAYAIGRDSSLWKDPLEFHPERFLMSGVEARGRDFELIPFGSGRRICPGLNLALNAVHVTLVNLVHAFEWSLPAGEVIDTVNEKYGLTVVMAKKLEAIPQARRTGF